MSNIDAKSLNERRIKAGLTFRELARISGYEYHLVSDWLSKGKRARYSESLEDIEEAIRRCEAGEIKYTRRAKT